MISKQNNYTFRFVIIAFLASITWVGFAKTNDQEAFFTRQKNKLYQVENKIETDTPDLICPISDSGGLIDLKDPLNLKKTIEYDPVTGRYEFKSTIGDSMDYKSPTFMTAEEYQSFQMQKSIGNYWRSKAVSQSQESRTTSPELSVGGGKFRDIFGSNKIDIRPNGSAERDTRTSHP